MSDVFMSYRRIDKDFVKRLDEALKANGKDVWIDWEDIPPGSVDFNQDLLRGIESSDALLAVLSPDYLVSEYCLGELRYAYENNKKLIPVVIREIDDTQLPDSIRHINQIFFNGEDSFDTALEKVIVALDNDWLYRQGHTRLITRAREWEREQEDNSFLLRGSDLANAEKWLIESGSKDPKPTELQTEYIIASRQAAVRRQRVTVGSLVVGLIAALILAVFALLGFQRAELNLDQALNTQALFLADLSRQQLEDEHYRVALLLSLESLSSYPRVFNSESSKALLNALNNPPKKLLALRYTDTINSIRWGSQTDEVLTASGDAAYLANVVSGDNLLILQHNGTVRGAIWNKDRSRILTWGDDGTAKVWDPLIQTELFSLRHLDAVNGAMWNNDETQILTWSADGTTRLWDAEGQAIMSFVPENPVSVLGAIWKQDASQIVTWNSDGKAYLWDINGQQLASFNQESVIRGAAWSRDGQRALIWSANGAVRVWALTGTLITILPTGADVQGASWSPDSTQILTWSLSGSVRTWDAAAGTQRLNLPHNRAVNGANWNSDGTRILSWSLDGNVRVWNAVDGIQLLNLSHNNSVNGAKWNDSESLILTWSTDTTVRLWNAVSGAELQRFQHSNSVDRAFLDEDRQLILSSTIDNRIHLWTTVEQAGEIQGPVINIQPESTTNGVVWNNAHTQFITWANDGAINVWDATSGQQLTSMRHNGAVNGAAWSKDESKILSWGADAENALRIWNAADGTLIRAFAQTSPVQSASWNADESRVSAWSTDGVVQVWDTSGENSLPVNLRHSGRVRGALWDARGKRILVWTNMDTVQIWDALEGEMLFNLPHDRGRLSFNVQGANWNTKGNQVLSWAQDGGVRVWNVPSENNNGDSELQPAITLFHPTVVRNAYWSPDESRIMTWTGKGDDVLRIWDASDGGILLALPHGASSFGISGATWNKDGSRILSWSSNGLVRIWNALAENPESAGLLAIQHNRNVLGAMWNQDETRILTWPSDSTLRVWDVDSGKELLLLNNPDVIQSAAWNADESRIISRIRGGIVSMWIVDVEELIAIGRSRIIFDLTNTERERFFLPALISGNAPTVTPVPISY